MSFFTVGIKKLSVDTDELMPAYGGKLIAEACIVEEIVGDEEVVEPILIEDGDCARTVNE